MVAASRPPVGGTSAFAKATADKEVPRYVLTPTYAARASATTYFPVDVGVVLTVGYLIPN